MPVIRKIPSARGGGYWSSFDPNNYRCLAEALKKEFRRSEPAHHIHFAQSGPDCWPYDVLNVKVGFYCLRDCLVFLARGAFFVDGQGMVAESGFVYVIKDEEWIGLGGNTTILVMEEGEMKGICARETEKRRKEWLIEKKREEGKRDGLWDKVQNKLRRAPEAHQVQCTTQ